MKIPTSNYDTWKINDIYDDEPYIICEDYAFEPIWSNENNEYFDTGESYLLIEEKDKNSYMYEFMQDMYPIVTTKDIERKEMF